MQQTMDEWAEGLGGGGGGENKDAGEGRLGTTSDARVTATREDRVNLSISGDEEGSVIIFAEAWVFIASTRSICRRQVPPGY